MRHLIVFFLASFLDCLTLVVRVESRGDSSQRRCWRGIKPLLSRLSALETARSFDFKAALEHSHTADVKAWERKTLPENLAARRMRLLSQTS